MGDIVIDGLPYPIVIADDAARSAPPCVPRSTTRLGVVFDRRLETRAKAVGAACDRAGLAVRGFVGLAGGEHLKVAGTLAHLYDAWLEMALDRSSIILAVGGGTLTDVTGFAAATYLRGVRWIPVPTTVLGMLDASIGGKTGIDLPQGKNLVGAFWPPAAVVADIAALSTLPARERATGLAEAIKCAVIGAPALLDAVERLVDESPPHNDGDGFTSNTLERWKTVIAAAAQLKARIVAADERENGVRSTLNLGHTVAHALEAASAHRLSHGEAVSVGLRASGLIALRHNMWIAADHTRLISVLRKAGLPLHVDGVGVDDVMHAIARDKKIRNGCVRFVLPCEIGKVRHGVEVDRQSIEWAVEACFAPPSTSEWSG